MLRLTDPSTVSYIGNFLRDSGYDVNQLGYGLDIGDGLYANLENLEPLLARTQGDSVIASLARLFFVSWGVEERRCQTILPRRFLEAAFDCGLLTAKKGQVVSTASLVPFRSLIIACDSSRTRTSLTDMVTGPSASTQIPSRLAVGGENETTLDLGTGSGALALEAASYSRRVVGTDINPRALEFAEFNAALNNISNVKWRCGDAFLPVRGELFSRIVANPPFFLSASKTFTYSDSPVDLDGFSAELATGCSAYLEEGGFYQMICEWVELEGQQWEQRLQDWTSTSGCDVLVLLESATNPIAYAEKRAHEARLMRRAGVDGYFEKQWRYLKNHSVKNVMAGVINMRKRSGGANWFAIVRTIPMGAHLGGDVRARFDALTFLATSGPDHIFHSRFKLSPDVILEQRSQPAFESGQWQAASIELVKQKGLTDRLRLDETVSAFVPLFDGTRTVAEIAEAVASHATVDLSEARDRCLRLARRLLQSNFVLVA